MHGVPIFDENGNRLGESKMAAKSAISQVVFSRIMMATPGMSKYYFLISLNIPNFIFHIGPDKALFSIKQY